MPSGRFEGIRNLVAYAMQLGHARLERLEQSLTWSDGHLPGKPGDDEFVPLRRALSGLDMASALFWRQSLLTALNEVSKEPHVEMTEERVTAIARRVVQLVMSNRSYEPRAY